MSTNKRNTQPEKSYPPFYEKIIPITIGVLALIIVVMLLFTMAVGVGILNFG